MYLLVVVGLNSLVFGYNFWNEPAPSSLADGVAVVSLLALAGVAVIAIGVMYTSMCAATRSPASAMSSFRTGASVTMRTPVILAGALVTVAATLSVIAGPIALAAVVLGAAASAFSALYDTEVDAGNAGMEPPPGFG